MILWQFPRYLLIFLANSFLKWSSKLVSGPAPGEDLQKTQTDCRWLKTMQVAVLAVATGLRQYKWRLVVAAGLRQYKWRLVVNSG